MKYVLWKRDNKNKQRRNDVSVEREAHAATRSDASWLEGWKPN
jgi:hypothetical protein